MLLCAYSGIVNAQAPFPSEALPRRSRSYDVLHYKIVVNFQEEQKKVIGTTSVTFVPLVDHLDSMVLDAVSMDVRSVSLMGGRPLGFTNRSPELAVHFPEPCTRDDTLTVLIEYLCTPKLGLYFIQPDSTDHTKHHQIWTQGEDMDNRYWFPCYDYPNDKATSEVIATVRDNYHLVSNGELVETKSDRKSGTRTFHWRQSKPHSSYLIMLAAGEYEVIQDHYRSIPLQYYVYRGQVDDARRTFAKTPAMLQFFEEKTGCAYPWEKFAQVIIDEFMWGGMENTSVVTLNAHTITDPRAELDFSSDGVISHELAHQWWGDLVTCRDWTNLWLNEGFAEYFDTMFKGHDKGRDEFQYELMNAAKNVLTAERGLGRKPIVSHDSYTTNLYSKGGWVLHMLRNILGEKEFLHAMNYYIRRYEYGVVDTHEFQLAIEDATGQNLQWFFDQWVYKAGYPALNVTKSWDNGIKNLTLTIKQTQPIDSLCGIFTLPLEIECTTPRGSSLTRVWVNKGEQAFTIGLDDEPLMVIADKGQKVLKSLDFEKPEQELLYQLEHAEDVNDRVDAAKEVRRFKESPAVLNALSRSAQRDRFWGVRREATISLGVMTAESVKETLFAVCKDRNSRVRHAAIVALDRFKDHDVSRFIQEAAASESSYVVLGSCISSLAEVDTANAFDFARRYVDVDSYRDIVRQAALSAMHELRDLRSLPFAIKYAGPGQQPETRALAVKIVSEMGERDSTAKRLLVRLVNDRNALVRTAAVQGLGGWGGDEARVAIEGRKQVEKDAGVLKIIGEVLKRLDEDVKNAKEN